jgi:hypothetical protein
MATSEFSYRPILQELTQVVNAQGLDPYEAYAWLYPQQTVQGLKPESYLTSSITSGGHARDDSLEMREVIARNTHSALLLAEQLANDRLLRREGAIEPVVVGKTQWNQAEFMEFWLSVIGGYQLTPGFVARDCDNLRTSARRSFEDADLNMDLMLSKAAAGVRAPEYFKMSAAFAGLVNGGMDAEPIGTLIRMIDTDMSLGSQAERAFARQIGTKVMNICIVRPALPQDLLQVNHALAVDTERLINFGAAVFDTSNNQVRLALTEMV